MANIGWQFTAWSEASSAAGATGSWADRAAFSVTAGAEAEANASMILSNLDQVRDETGAKITDGSAAGNYTLLLGSSLDNALAAATGTSLYANVGTSVAGQFASLGVSITSDNKLNINSLTLSGTPVIHANDTATSVAGAPIIKVNSNTLTQVTGSSAADILQLDNFGSSGNISLGAGADNLLFTKALTSKTIVVDGGKDNDTIDAGSSTITVQLGSYTSRTDNDGTDSVGGWASRVATGGIIKLASGQTFSNVSVTDFVNTAGAVSNGGYRISSYNTAAAVTTAGVLTSFSLADIAAAGRTSYSTFIQDDSVTKNALIVGGAVVANDLSSTDVNATNLYVGTVSINGAQKAAGVANTLDFTNSGKTRIYLGHTDGSNAEYGDTSQYINIDEVTGASVGGSLLLAGASKGVSLTAGGANDSLCGLGDKSDTLISAGNQRTFFGTGTGTGADVVNGFTFGNQQNVASDAVVFATGVDFSKVKVNGTSLQVGSSDTDYLSLDTTNAGGATTYLNYMSGLGADLKTANIDLSGSATLQFNKDLATIYVGGTTSADATKLNLGSEAVSIGWSAVTDYDTYGLAEIDGSSTSDGSVINGSAEKANTVKGSASAFSAICGGFSGDYADTKADTLVGGGNDSQTTAYFVGKYLGSDEIQNLSSKDVVNFLNTNFTDITGATNTADSLVVYFTNGDKVTAKTGSTLANTKDVTFNFLDGHTTWDGTKFTDFVKNA